MLIIICPVLIFAWLCFSMQAMVSHPPVEPPHLSTSPEPKPISNPPYIAHNNKSLPTLMVINSQTNIDSVNPATPIIDSIIKFFPIDLKPIANKTMFSAKYIMEALILMLTLASKLHIMEAIPENPVGEMLFGFKNTLKEIPIKNVPNKMQKMFRVCEIIIFFFCFSKFSPPY